MTMPLLVILVFWLSTLSSASDSLLLPMGPWSEVYWSPCCVFPARFDPGYTPLTRDL